MFCIRTQRGCTGQGSNSQPSGPKFDALTTEPPRLPQVNKLTLKHLYLRTLKAAKYGIQKPKTCRATLFCFKFLVNVSRFSPCRINLSRDKDICCGLKKVVAQSRARVNFEQQSKTFNLSRNKFVVMPPSWMPTKQINQSACCISSTCNKCFCCATS